jgi:hypothetical protein
MKPQLTELDRRTLDRLAQGNVRSRNTNGVIKQSLDRLVKKGLADKFKGAFAEDEWSAKPVKGSN